MRIPALRLVHVVLMTGSPHLGQSIGICVFRGVNAHEMDQPRTAYAVHCPVFRFKRLV